MKGKDRARQVIKVVGTASVFFFSGVKCGEEGHYIKALACRFCFVFEGKGLAQDSNCVQSLGDVSQERNERHRRRARVGFFSWW